MQNVYENKTQDQLNKGEQPKFIGHAEIDLQGNISNIIKENIEVFIPTMINGRKFLQKGNVIYSFLTPVDLEKGLKPVRLFEQK